MKPHLTLRGGVFVAVFAGENGQRVRRSTRMTTPEAAQAELARMVREAEQVRAGILPPPERTKGRAKAPSLLELVDEWAKGKARKGLTLEYVHKARGTIERAIKRMRWGSAKDLNAAGLELLRERWLLGGASVALCNARMRHMGSFCVWLWRTGRIPADPTVNVSAIPYQPRRRRALSIDELGRLFQCSAIPAEARRAYRALFYSGMRVDRELGMLCWQQVGEDGVLRFVGKGGRLRTVPIGDALRAVLDEQRAALAARMVVGGPVFPSIPSPRHFAKHLELAGIPREDVRGHVATRHSLRHSFNQELTRAGVTSEVRQHLGGWSDDQMPVHQYQDARALDLLAAVNRLPRMIG